MFPEMCKESVQQVVFNIVNQELSLFTLLHNRIHKTFVGFNFYHFLHKK